MEIFSFRHMEWREGPAMPAGMSGSFHGAAVPLRDGFVLVGGSSERGRVYHRTLHYFVAEAPDESGRWEGISAALDYERGFHIALPVTQSMGICS